MRFRPQALCAGVCLLGLVGPPALAEAPDAGAPPDGYEDDADRGILECPADRIQARKAREAALEGARRIFVSVTGETVNSAHLQATAYFDAVESAFVSGALVRVREALGPLAVAARISAPAPGDTAPKDGRVSADACRVMAARDDAGCGALAPNEQDACRAWLAAWRATRGGVDGCAVLGEPDGSVCRAVYTQSAAACEALSDAARALCEATVATIKAAELHCGARLDPSRCGWALLGRGLAGDRKVCEAAAPSAERSTAAHERTHQLCLAVLGAEPHRCPEGGAASGRTLPSVAEVAVVGSLAGPWAVVVLASPTPSTCRLEVTVRSGGVEREFVSMVRQGSWAPTVWRLPLPLSVDSFASAASVRSLCVPRITW
jgi:hypothetical protein